MMEMPRIPKGKAGWPAKAKPINPIEAAIRSWCSSLTDELTESIQLDLPALIVTAPKRWSVYPPMVLLPPGSFPLDWNNHGLSSQQNSRLWPLILEEIGKREGKGLLTHLAINSGIPFHKSEDEVSQTDSSEISRPENILRTPSGLIMLHGDFGPALSPDISPTSQDLKNAFWVSTKQNGIIQAWAPRYTMFSRGNIKEKARLLNFHEPTDLERQICDKELMKHSAIDFYAGIGYFVFSYVKMGMGRVFGWEMNPWSVEGLRRGALANGWSVKVIMPGETVKWVDEKIIIFLEDNTLAGERMQHGLLDLTVLHVNCGLLPTSLPIWKRALEVVGSHGWLHLHENVAVNSISERAGVIEQMLEAWELESGGRRRVKFEHIEQVKTFAPGVWHCVFDFSVQDVSRRIPGLST